MSKNNILVTYQNASEEEKRKGLSWYDEAHTFCKEIAQNFGVDFLKVVGVVSAISPSVRWEQNKKSAVTLIKTWIKNPDISFTEIKGIVAYKKNIKKALQILNSEIYSHETFFTGPKTRAFAENITDPKNSIWVTVDIWAYRIYKNSPRSNPKKGLVGARYKKIANAFLRAAKQLNISPVALQATTWVHFRKKFSRIKNESVTLDNLT